MPEYDLRSAFPLNNKDFVVNNTTWTCHLAEVSDQRPDADRLSWYLVFQTEHRTPGKALDTRKLEIVTSATRLLEAGFPEDLEDRLVEWLFTNEQDGRQEWLDY
jgi:LAS superfamily LD-carboxypeptidase LdcB